MLSHESQASLLQVNRWLTSAITATEKIIARERQAEFTQVSTANAEDLEALADALGEMKLARRDLDAATENAR